MSEQRLLLVNRIKLGGEAVATVSRDLGVSRKTAYKWLARHTADPQKPLEDHSRRPHSQPRRASSALEAQVVAARDAHGWGARKLRAMLPREQPAPSIRTVHQILKRHGRVPPATPPAPPALERFERPQPNQLWQLDHKGPVEIARHRRHPLTILDDHSRYLLRIEPCVDLTMAAAWAVLWDVFGDAGLPEAILCDGAFAARNSPTGTLSRFESWLIRLGIRPVHGRPYHPQTQGKIERLHGTFEREMYRRVRFDCDEHFRADAAAWRDTYNFIRPHEALGDQTPSTRWRASERKRPDCLPEVVYPAGSVLRRSDSKGTICYAGGRIAVGEGLAGEQVRLIEDDRLLRVYYSWKEIRLMPLDSLNGNRKQRLRV